MKIALVSRYPPHKCGIAIYAKNFVNSFRSSGNDVEIISFSGYKYADGGVIPILKKNSISTYFKATNYIVKNKFDKVIIQHEYVFYNPLIFPLFILYLKLRRKKVNLVMHTIPFYKDFLRKTIFKFWNSSFLLFTDQLYLHTTNAMKKIKKTSFIQARKNTLIPIPITLAVKTTPKITKSRKTKLLAQGFISEDKGYDLILSAFGGYKEFEVKIMGTVNESSMKKQHDYFDMIKEQAKKYPNIKVIDKFLSEKEKRQAVMWADFILLPYTKTEQSANLTTAWGHYKIPICSDIIPFKEEIKNNKYGVLFRNKDSVDLRKATSSLKESPGQQKKILQNIKKLVNERSFSEVAKKIVRSLV